MLQGTAVLLPGLTGCDTTTAGPLPSVLVLLSCSAWLAEGALSGAAVFVALLAPSLLWSVPRLGAERPAVGAERPNSCSHTDMSFMCVTNRSGMYVK